MRRRTPRPGPALRLLLLVAALLLPAGPRASAADNGTWSVFPTPGAGRTDRAYFFHQGAAGTAVSDSVTVLNSSDRELALRIFAADAVNTRAGGAFALLPLERPPRDVGAWVTLAPQAAQPVTVPARGRVDIPFTVRVPQDAAPGDHVGGIVAVGTAVEGVRREGGLQVGVRRQVGARLYFRVPGPVVPALSVEEVRVRRTAPLLPWTGRARATISYVLVNRGNVVVEPEVAVTAEGLFGRTLLDRPARGRGPALLPGGRVELSQPWPDAPQADRVTVRIRAGSAAHPGLSAEGGTRFAAVPWTALGLLLPATAATAAALLRRCRRRRRHRCADRVSGCGGSPGPRPCGPPTGRASGS
ncbi:MULTISPECIES: DUF916 domain-containing protein [Streptomyces]|uniref:DUF916 domain-containing protein n=1 Tax=Streptomyces TaxID=1883 RepID=UPI00167599DB|nr:MULTISPECIES: DUF916 domain-containing protein [Streptomyces]MBD3579555.1 DUF916 domain-containing protein [Streptomyces sp. KD18]GGS89978.1 hypothetical protein GCM10010286_13350 [Streptomyces toxytricini]